MKNAKNMKKFIIMLIFIVIITIIVISLTVLVKQINSKIDSNKKASIESEIQLVIDETKQEIGENEGKSVTLKDLKEKFAKLGYTLDDSTGQLQYNGYIVTIDNELNIQKIKLIETTAWYEISNVNNDDYTAFIVIENKKGIERITSDDLVLNVNGKKQIAFDKICKEGDIYQFKIKIVGESEEELYTMVASKKIKAIVQDVYKQNDKTKKTIEIEYPENSNFINYYSLDNGNTWNLYSGQFDVEVSDDICILAKSDYNVGKTIYNYDNYIWGTTKEHGILGEIEEIHETGDYTITITENGIEYPIHLYCFEGDQIWTENQTFGTSEDIGTSSTDAKNTVVVKVHGNLTIEEGIKVTAYSTEYGGPKGLIIYCTGTLTNNGTISMTGKGAKAQGQNVYMYKNYTDESEARSSETPFNLLKDRINEYEYVPATGATGGNKINLTAIASNGNNGKDGIGRQSRRRRNRSWNKHLPYIRCCSSKCRWKRNFLFRWLWFRSC